MLNFKSDYQKLSRRYGKMHALILTSVSLICIILGVINIILSFTIQFNLIAMILLSILGFFVGFYFIYLFILRWYLKRKVSLL